MQRRGTNRRQGPKRDPNAPPEQFLRMTDNSPLLNQVRAMASRTAAARAAATRTAKVGKSAPHEGAGRKQTASPLAMRERAADWANEEYALQDSSAGSSEEAVANSESGSATSEESFEALPVATRGKAASPPLKALPDGVIDLSYIITHKPPPNIIRNFIRAQVTSLDEAALEDEFA